MQQSVSDSNIHIHTSQLSYQLL